MRSPASQRADGKRSAQRRTRRTPRGNTCPPAARNPPHASVLARGTADGGWHHVSNPEPWRIPAGQRDNPHNSRVPNWPKTKLKTNSEPVDSMSLPTADQERDWLVARHNMETEGKRVKCTTHAGRRPTTVTRGSVAPHFLRGPGHQDPVRFIWGMVSDSIKTT